jgi:CDGSH-type Zn-finger protein
MKITVSKNDSYIVTDGVSLKTEEICNEDEGYSRTWKETKVYPLDQQYALCRCGHSKNKPFCDGNHARIHFDGTEAGDREPSREGAGVIQGPTLTLADNEPLCVHARFCMRAGHSFAAATGGYPAR